jgi:membrane protein required for colicin V production
MNNLDVLLLLIVGLSVLAGLMKGLIREVFSLAGVLLGIILALLFSPQFSEFLGRWIPYENAAYGAALFIIFTATILAATMLAHVLTKAVEVASLGFMNRLLGGAFGILRGALIGLILVLGLTLILDPGHDVLTGSRVTPYLALGARAVAPVLPTDIRGALLERLDALPRIGAEDLRDQV